MRAVSAVVAGISRLAKLDLKLSKEGSKRLEWFDYYDSHGLNARLVCRHFDISPQTFYRWGRRYDPHHLESMESRSRHPKRVRQPTYPLELVIAVQKLRGERPWWGKDKLAPLLQQQGFTCSASMVELVISRLEKRGLLKEPVGNHVSAQRKGIRRPYGIRNSGDYQVKEPGDLVQVDTLGLRPLPGLGDIISRWDVVNDYRRATAAASCEFLNELELRMPFKVSLSWNARGVTSGFFSCPIRRSLMGMLSGHIAHILKNSIAPLNCPN